MDMFTFFGNLIGFAIRSQSALPLHFPPLFWKLLLGDKPDFSDLQGIDTYSSQVIEDLRKQALKLSD